MKKGPGPPPEGQPQSDKVELSSASSPQASGCAVPTTGSNPRASQHQARIHPNSNQIDAVIVGGCILADDFGLSKTVEAGLVIAQRRRTAHGFVGRRSSAGKHHALPDHRGGRRGGRPSKLATAI